MEPTETMDGLGRRLKLLRDQELRMTTRELSDELAKIGVAAKNATISRYEGGREPSLAFVVGLADLLGSTVDYVLDGNAPRRYEPSAYERAYAEIRAIVLRVEGRIEEREVKSVGPGDVPAVPGPTDAPVNTSDTDPAD